MQNKRDAVETIEVGDRINWPDGCNSVWGTVVEIVERTTVQGVNGPVFTGIIARIHCTDYPMWDSHGWPKSKDCTVTRTFRWASDLYLAYTPTA